MAGIPGIGKQFIRSSKGKGMKNCRNKIRAAKQREAMLKREAAERAKQEQQPDYHNWNND